MHDGIYLTDIRQELIPQSLSFGGSFYKSRDIYKLYRRRDDLLCVVHVSQYLKPFVRHRYHAHIGVDGAERIVGRLCPGLCQ